MDKIIKELHELEELMLQCMKCGTCQSDCPLYRTDQRESSVARGKISLLQSVYEGRIEDAGEILEHLDKCLLCGRCKHVCPSGVRTDEIFLKGREVLRKIKKLPKWQKSILKIAMEKPELMAKLSPLMHIGLKFGSKKIKDDIYKPLLPMLHGRTVVSVKSKPFTTEFGGFHKAENERDRVLFYPGCAINFIYTDWGEAAVKVLNHFGVSVHVPHTNICCGIPAATMGELALYKKMVTENLDLFANFDVSHIITACPTCRYGLYEMGEKQTKRRSKADTTDILVYLKEVLKIDLRSDRTGTSTVHFPCHYQQEKHGVVESFVKENTSTEYKKLRNQSCCGFAGTFSMKYYDRSKGFAMSKTDEMADKGADVVYTPCPGCAMQLTDGVTQKGADIEVLHPIVEIYRQIRKNDEI